MATVVDKSGNNPIAPNHTDDTIVYGEALIGTPSDDASDDTVMGRLQEIADHTAP